MDRSPRTPYPNGWFRLAYSHEVARGAIRRVSALGQELIVFRGDDGHAAVTDAYCPHLGADLSAGGRVIGNAVSCPFHSWQFAGDGRCVKIPYCDKIPKKAAIRSWPVREQDGVVYFYHDAHGRPPAFDLPPGPFRAGVRWSEPMFLRWRVRLHVQDVVEHAVDTAHFPIVHAHGQPPVIERLDTDGPRFAVRLHTQRAGTRFLGPSPITIRYIGMGVTYAALTGRLGDRVAVEAAALLNTTPLDADHCELVIQARFRRSRNPLWNAVLARLVRHEIASDLGHELPIWEARRDAARPLLADAGGPIDTIRGWCQQFYDRAPRTAHVG